MNNIFSRRFWVSILYLKTHLQEEETFQYYNRNISTHNSHLHTQNIEHRHQIWEKIHTNIILDNNATGLKLFGVLIQSKYNENWQDAIPLYRLTFKHSRFTISFSRHEAGMHTVPLTHLVGIIDEFPKLTQFTRILYAVENRKTSCICCCWKTGY